MSIKAAFKDSAIPILLTAKASYYFTAVFHIQLYSCSTSKFFI